jgi:hypothetical protein
MMDISWHEASDVLNLLRTRAKQFYGCFSVGLLLFLVCYVPLARKRHKQPHRANVRLSTALRTGICAETTSRSAGEHQRDA